MGDHAEKLIADAPRQEPGAAPCMPALQKRVTALVLGRRSIRSVDENVGVDDEQLLGLHRSVERVAVGDIDVHAAAFESR